MSEVYLEYTNEQSQIEISEELVEAMRRAAQSVLEREQAQGNFEISLTITDAPTIRRLNADFRNINRVTDVLSFPLGEGGVFEKNFATGATVLGDIVICATRAAEQAQEYGHSLQREFGFLCAHSVLHLLGYDHVGSVQEAAVMEQKQEAALAAIGLAR